MTDETVSYFYAVCRGLDADRVADVRGVSSSPVRCVGYRDLTAVVSQVAAGEFGASALQENLEDLRWLESVARAHDHVVAALADVATTVPLRLATVCVDDASVRAKLADRYDDVCGSLDRLDGRVEWGVKAFLEPGTDAGAVAGDGAAASGTGTGTGTGSGAAYLRRRQQAAVRRNESVRAATEFVEAVHGELRGLAVDARRYPPQDERLSGRRGRMLLNGAYLVDEDASWQVENRVEELRHTAAAVPTVHLEVTGPWPGYSFAQLESV